MSFVAIVNAILNALKLSWPILLALLFFSSIIIFMPDSWGNSFGVSSQIEIIRPYCFFCALLCACLLLAHLTNQAHNKFQEYWNERNLQKRLHMLSEPEKSVLREYIEKNTKTQYFRLDDGVIGGLEAWGIVYRAANISHGCDVSFPYNLQPWAWNYLKDNSEILNPKN